ncbi:MAG: DUF5060 domain-containing protein [Bacteroides sp.]|nr:DUF5060 domain-containing protein [Bacteroides sp.]
MKQILISLIVLGFSINSIANDFSDPIVGEDVVFEEVDGVVAVEAEFFYKQSETEIRQWYRTSKEETPSVGRDEDEPHLAGASNGAYIEILPDTRVTHDDKLIAGENFSNLPGKMAVVHYKVYFNHPGKYYVWVRAHSVGAEDNGLHVGMNGDWPKTGQRLQWCEGKRTWRWESKQRTEKVHCGEPYLIYLEIEKPGLHDIHFSLREDGFEFDKFIMTKEKDPDFGSGPGPAVKLKSGTLPPPFPVVPFTYMERLENSVPGTHIMKATDFPIEGTNFYINNTWLAINPEQHKKAMSSLEFPFEDGTYDLIFVAVGENDGSSEYKVWVNEAEVGSFVVPMSESMFDEGPNYNDLWEGIDINKGDKVSVEANIGSADGQEFSRGRWAGIAFAPITKGKIVTAVLKNAAVTAPVVQLKEPELKFSDPAVRQPDGDGSVSVSGELKEWHKVTLTLDGPFAHELDKDPNAFTDYNLMVNFTHSSGTPSYDVPGYFAADGNASETSADAGIKWRAHLSPDKAGKWTYTLTMKKGKNAAQENSGEEIGKYSGITGEFTVGKTNKTGRDFRSQGRLEYVGRHHLQFQGSKEFFLKAGSDAPETLLAYEDFDATYSLKANAPIKKYSKHIGDWKEDYPTWKNGKGKGLIGAVAYMSGKGANSISFLPYNAGGDGENVWPFIKRNEKFHYDCSKLDQWAVVFDFAQAKGVYLHFKMQENEMDDNVKGKDPNVVIKESLDGGDLGPERKLYCRELIARFGYLLALNWNIGEENTQSTRQVNDMVNYISDLQPYNHNIVIHTFPSQQDKVYTPLLGDKSRLTGVSLQNEWNEVFEKTLHWRLASAEAGRPWVVANDEQGSATEGVPPDPGYNGYKANTISYDIHDIRKQTLYANLMAGGAGVEYYFGYKLPENDLIAEDFRSRDKSWGFAKIALDFFGENIPFQDMQNADALIGNTDGDKGKHCLAQEGKIYLIYLAYEKTTSLDLTGTKGSYKVKWFNPRTGGDFQATDIKKVKGGKLVELGMPPSDEGEDWLIVVSK